MLHKHSTVLCYPGLQMVMQQLGIGFKPVCNVQGSTTLGVDNTGKGVENGWHNLLQKLLVVVG